MIEIEDKSRCCGCEACVQVCPKHCISFTQDSEGFFYPETDKTICIECGLCVKVCPVLTPYDEHTPQEILAAINKNEEVRMNSSSGGVFTLLAEHVIEQGGVVFGVRFNEDWLAVFDYAETKEQIVVFRGSKYLQARVGNSYIQCKNFLEQGRQVLFSGTQCQIAGLLHFLHKPYPNLLTVDFICHGVPSPKVWSRYLYEVVKVGKYVISDVQFRNKKLGWKRYYFLLNYKDELQSYTYTSPYSENPYMKAFLANIILRPSCYTCQAKSGRSHADITIADFWGIDKVNPQMDDDKGTSLVLINNSKGAKSLQRDKLYIVHAIYEDVRRYNPSIEKSSTKHPKRFDFFRDFTYKSNLNYLFKYYLCSSNKQKIL